MNNDQLTPKLREQYKSYLQLAWVFVAILVVGQVVRSAESLLQVIRNTDVPVPVHFDSAQALVPFGEANAMISATATTGILVVPEMPIAGQWALILEHTLKIGASLVFAVALYLLFAQVLRGDVFTKRSVAIVDVITAAVIVYAGLASFFKNMASNAAFAQVSNYTVDNPGTEGLAWRFYALLVAVLCLSLFFRAGKNVADQTEGLV